MFSVRACDGTTVHGGRRVWTRTHDGTTDVKVAYEIPSEGSQTVRVECRSP